MLNPKQAAFLSFIEKNPITAIAWVAANGELTENFDDRQALRIECALKNSAVIIPMDTWREVLPYVGPAGGRVLMYLSESGMLALDEYRESRE